MPVMPVRRVGHAVHARPTMARGAVGRRARHGGAGSVTARAVSFRPSS